MWESSLLEEFTERRKQRDENEAKQGDAKDEKEGEKGRWGKKQSGRA